MFTDVASFTSQGRSFHCWVTRFVKKYIFPYILTLPIRSIFDYSLSPMLSACQIHLISVKNAGYANVNDTPEIGPVQKSSNSSSDCIVKVSNFYMELATTWIIMEHLSSGWQFYFEILMDGLFLSLLNYCPILTEDDFPYFRILNFINVSKSI